MTREDQITALAQTYEPQDGWAVLDARGGEGTDSGYERFALVEANRHGGHWISTHATLEDAGKYYAGQEYPEDFSIEVCIDLDTGQTYHGETEYHVSWTERT